MFQGHRVVSGASLPRLSDARDGARWAGSPAGGREPCCTQSPALLWGLGLQWNWVTGSFPRPSSRHSPARWHPSRQLRFGGKREGWSEWEEPALPPVSNMRPGPSLWCSLCPKERNPLPPPPRADGGVTAGSGSGAGKWTGWPPPRGTKEPNAKANQQQVNQKKFILNI